MPRNAATEAARLSVAPMMDWTDRHCRAFHRLMSREALLYTEMVTAAAVLHGDRERLLGFDEVEHPLAVQLGGDDPMALAEAARAAVARGYDEVNLNVGCPSDRVQSGTFGAVLMKDPALVADCARAMIDASSVDVTVKCRIGVDDQDPETVLPDFVARMRDTGVRRMAIHARKAWLDGLSPKENRDIPPLDYPLVYRMAECFPDMHLSINGGIASLDDARSHLANGMDGAMVGRAAYHQPYDILAGADALIMGQGQANDRMAVIDAMRPYIAAHLDAGVKLAQVTRHMLGLFSGQPGARAWRRVLSEQAHRDGAGPEVLDLALDAMPRAA